MWLIVAITMSKYLPHHPAPTTNSNNSTCIIERVEDHNNQYRRDIAVSLTLFLHDIQNLRHNLYLKCIKYSISLT